MQAATNQRKLHLVVLATVPGTYYRLQRVGRIGTVCGGCDRYKIPSDMIQVLLVIIVDTCGSHSIKAL